MLGQKQSLYHWHANAAKAKMEVQNQDKAEDILVRWASNKSRNRWPRRKTLLTFHSSSPKELTRNFQHGQAHSICTFINFQCHNSTAPNKPGGMFSYLTNKLGHLGLQFAIYHATVLSLTGALKIESLLTFKTPLVPKSPQLETYI